MPSKRSVLVLVLLILLCIGGGSLSGLLSADSMSTWYRDLNRPFFTPPGWVFGPAWLILYTLMAIACWRVWRRCYESFKAMGSARNWFFVQLGLNFLWTPVFFGMHAIWPALLVIILLWFAILQTMRAFANFDKPAVWMLAPYLAWVGFATVLNAAFAVLN